MIIMKQVRPEVNIPIARARGCRRHGSFAEKRQARAPGARRHLCRRRTARWQGTFRSKRRFVDDMVVVSNDEISAAIKDVYEDRRSILSRPGRSPMPASNATSNATSCGIDLSPPRLRRQRQLRPPALYRRTRRDRRTPRGVAGRHHSGAARQAAAFAASWWAQHHRVQLPLQRSRRRTSMSAQVREAEKISHLLATLRRNGYPVLDMTDNEMAKLHIRHLVGGRASNAEHEILYRFEFPERPAYC